MYPDIVAIQVTEWRDLVLQGETVSEFSKKGAMQGQWLKLAEFG